MSMEQGHCTDIILFLMRKSSTQFLFCSLSLSLSVCVFFHVPSNDEKKPSIFISLVRKLRDTCLRHMCLYWKRKQQFLYLFTLTQIQMSNPPFRDSPSSFSWYNISTSFLVNTHSLPSTHFFLLLIFLLFLRLFILFSHFILILSFSFYFSLLFTLSLSPFLSLLGIILCVSVCTNMCEYSYMYVFTCAQKFIRKCVGEEGFSLMESFPLSISMMRTEWEREKETDDRERERERDKLTFSPHNKSNLMLLPLSLFFLRFL